MSVFFRSGTMPGQGLSGAPKNRRRLTNGMFRDITGTGSRASASDPAGEKKSRQAENTGEIQVRDLSEKGIARPENKDLRRSAEDPPRSVSLLRVRSGHLSCHRITPQLYNKPMFRTFVRE